MPNTPYNGAGSSGSSTGSVKLSLVNGWLSNNVHIWANSASGNYVSNSNSTSYITTPDFIGGPYATSWANTTRTGVTIEIWFYLATFATTLISEHGSGGPGLAGFHCNAIEVNSNGNVVADIWPYVGGPITTANSATAGAWNHVIYTYTSATSTLTLQLNNGTVATGTGKSWTSAEGSGGLYYALAYPDSTNLSANANLNYYNGRWGKLRIANYPMASNYTTDVAKYV